MHVRPDSIPGANAPPGTYEVHVPPECVPSNHGDTSKPVKVTVTIDPCLSFVKQAVPTSLEFTHCHWSRIPGYLLQVSARQRIQFVMARASLFFNDFE